MFSRRYDVFLSYSRADTERVAPLRDALRHMGYSVFFDTQSIDPGEQWKTRLERSIQSSRTLVLCWSENTRGSDYITFEYSRAEALHKPVYPWLLDKTPLPAMLEVQAITAPDAGHAAQALRPALGKTMGQRRNVLMAIAVLAAVVIAVGIWFLLRPPPPWHFQGEVTDRVTSLPIAGVEVDVFSGDRIPSKAFTDSQGQFDLLLAPPQRPHIHVRFRKDGYQPEEPFEVTTGKRLEEDMVKLQ